MCVGGRGLRGALGGGDGLVTLVTLVASDSSGIVMATMASRPNSSSARLNAAGILADAVVMVDGLARSATARISGWWMDVGGGWVGT